MSKHYTIRCKTPNNSFTITSLTDQHKLSDLKSALVNTTGINRLKVLYGYPPKELDLNQENLALTNLFKTQRESLIVSENVSTSLKDAGSSSNYNSNNLNCSPVSTTNSFQAKKDAGCLRRKVVPANNSCLFTSVYFCISNGVFDPEIGNEMRKIIVKKVKNDPERFNDAILGYPNQNYCERIMNEVVWGGAIELAILSEHYSVEIVAVDTIKTTIYRKK